MRNEHSTETSAPYRHKSSALSSSLHQFSPEELQLPKEALFLFLHVLGDSKHIPEQKVFLKRGNKLMGEKIQTSLSQGHSKIRACSMLGEFRGNSTALGAGMAGLYHSSPALLQHESRQFILTTSSAAKDGEHAHCHLDLKHPNVLYMYH